MAWLLIKLIRGYQYFLSPWVGNNCRFSPTCSQYCIDAIRSWGALKGSWLGFRRIVRCNPWCAGGDDPVPSHNVKNRTVE